MRRRGGAALARARARLGADPTSRSGLLSRCSHAPRRQGPEPCARSRCPARQRHDALRAALDSTRPRASCSRSPVDRPARWRDQPLDEASARLARLARCVEPSRAAIRRRDASGADREPPSRAPPTADPVKRPLRERALAPSTRGGGATAPRASPGVSRTGSDASRISRRRARGCRTRRPRRAPGVRAAGFVGAGRLPTSPAPAEPRAGLGATERASSGPRRETQGLRRGPAPSQAA
jgi:hypothetical protein